MITIPFDAVPGTSLLFNDYCKKASEASKYFIGHFTDPAAYEAQLQFLSQRKYFREELAAILHRQNTSFKSGERTLQNAKLLETQNTFCVVTGQQVGLFTGPLYTIYKALTARHLASWLSDRFPSHNFIPVFWLETEDHDLEEANEAGFLTRQNDLEFVSNGEIDPENKNHHPVGSLPLSATIDETIAKLRELLQPTDFSESVLVDIASSYHADATYGEAFARLFNTLAEDSGIVFVDPSDTSLKQFLSPIIVREIETHPVTSEVVIAISAELEEHYHAQVKPRALNLFYHHNDKRYPIEPAESDYFLRGSRKRLTQEELLQQAQEYPETFSPNVLLRPIFQDYLFPTVSYVAGPSEVAYFAQLGPVYDHFQIPMPIICPRASVSLFEKKTVAVLEKYNLPFASVFESEDEILKEIFVGSAGEESTIQDYHDLKSKLQDSFDMLVGFATTFDANLRKPAETTVENINRSLATFEEKMFQMKKQQDDVARRQIDKLLSNIMPGGKPQERMLNVINFINKYGPDFIKAIDEISFPFPAEHRLLLM